jgi:hypothetical protein
VDGREDFAPVPRNALSPRTPSRLRPSSSGFFAGGGVGPSAGKEDESTGAGADKREDIAVSVATSEACGL